MVYVDVVNLHTCAYIKQCMISFQWIPTLQLRGWRLPAPCCRGGQRLPPCYGLNWWFSNLWCRWDVDRWWRKHLGYKWCCCLRRECDQAYSSLPPQFLLARGRYWLLSCLKQLLVVLYTYLRWLGSSLWLGYYINQRKWVTNFRWIWKMYSI